MRVIVGVAVLGQPPRYITDPDVIQRILNHIEAQPPPIKVIDHPKG